MDFCVTAGGELRCTARVESPIIGRVNLMMKMEPVPMTLQAENLHCDTRVPATTGANVEQLLRRVAGGQRKFCLA